MADRPRIVCIPSADLEFGRTASALYAELPDDLPPSALAEELGRRLRARYPAALVRPREEIASVVPGEDLLYVSNRAYGSRLSASVEVPVPVDEAFGTYVERMDEWLTALEVRPVVLESHLVGSVFSVRYELFGRIVRGQLRIVAADPPRWIRYEAHGAGIEAWFITSFSEADAGTTIRVVGDYDLPGRLLPRLVGRLRLERTIDAQIDASHEALRALCAGAARVGVRVAAESPDPTRVR